MSGLQDVNEDPGNGFGYGQLDTEQFEMEEDGDVKGFSRRFNVLASFVQMKTREVCTKTRVKSKKHCNEYRLGTFILLIIVGICFIILLHLNQKFVPPEEDVNNVNGKGNEV